MKAIGDRMILPVQSHKINNIPILQFLENQNSGEKPNFGMPDAFKLFNEYKLSDTNPYVMEPQIESDYKEDSLLKNNLSTQLRIEMDKLFKAFTVYPARGLTGSRNSNFYEFLTMGTVPYIIGSVMLMSIFNSKAAYSISDKVGAAKLGNKMALGVLFYGIFKALSKSLINIPVKMFTGIDTQVPYAKVNYLLQEPGSKDLTSIEYHKVGESVDFTRWDQLYGNPEEGEPLNFRYDKIAKKVGLGENLVDSDQEVKPIYKEVLVKSNLARTFSSYLWAAVGVALAFQDSWKDYFKVATLKFWKPKVFLDSIKTFAHSFKESVKELYKGPTGEISSLKRHGGKYLIGTALAVTVLGVLNAINITKKPSRITADDVMVKNKESVVS